jgi:hypothetical protein
MKKLYLLFLLIFSFVILSCPKEPEPEPPPTLDQRLVGGKWYFPATYTNTTAASLKPKTEDGYYKFTDDGKLIYSYETTYYKNIANTLSGSKVFSKNGIVYISDPYCNVIKYDFPSTFPHSNTSDFFITTDQHSTLDDLASKGDLIIYRIYKGNSFYEDSRKSQYWFLVRFTDDGKPYRNYD